MTSVLQATSQLLGPQLSNRKTSDLTTLDLFLLMASVLWHDVGNVYGRSEHAERVAEMTADVKSLGFPNPDIQRLVNEISIAHAGEDGLSKPRPREDVSTLNQQYTVYPVALAALVRFADEVSETQARISHALLARVPAGNRIYWEYASCIAASIPDPARQVVRVSVNVAHDAAVASYDITDPTADSCQRHYREVTGSDKISLIEYVVSRLEKMNNERSYCAPRFNRYADIRDLEVHLTLMNANRRVEGYEDVFLLGDGGLQQSHYPSIALFQPFFRDHKRWHPDALKQEAANQ